jgi:hypothetical protein
VTASINALVSIITNGDKGLRAMIAADKLRKEEEERKKKEKEEKKKQEELKEKEEKEKTEEEERKKKEEDSEERKKKEDEEGKKKEEGERKKKEDEEGKKKEDEEGKKKEEEDKKNKNGTITTNNDTIPNPSSNNTNSNSTNTTTQDLKETALRCDQSAGAAVTALKERVIRGGTTQAGTDALAALIAIAKQGCDDNTESLFLQALQEVAAADDTVGEIELKMCPAGGCCCR